MAQRRRQARGERRIDQILDAAAAVFAERGYEPATTNAIAAAAGISPGSLYQFFRNKEAIAQALAGRFAQRLAAAHEEAFDPAEAATLPLPALLDRVIDPIVAVNVAHPGLKSLLATELPERLSAPIRPLQQAVTGRIEAIIAARAPDLPAPDRARQAMVTLQIFKGMLPLVVAAPPAERELLVTELKRVLAGYLGPTIGEAGAPRARSARQHGDGEVAGGEP